ncbi:hypothetical protein SUGI_0310620 [Cryptomeria japonica]|nr:hypothetical protein SUGI_0310620 [Cryptomeria japonica]
MQSEVYLAHTNIDYLAEMFACLADEMRKVEENTEEYPSLEIVDIKNMKIKLKTELKPNIARLVEEDNPDELEELLLSERNLETIPSSKKGKKNKKNVSKETDEFSKLARRIFHYACALDSIKCCKILLDSEKFTPVSIDAVDEVEQRSGLHIASFCHNHKSVDLLLKKGANSILLNRHSMMPLEEALLSPNLDVDWDLSTDASEIVKQIGEKDLKVLKTLVIKCSSKEAFVALAFKFAKNLTLVPLVALLHVRRSIINTVMKSSEFDTESGGTILDYMLEKVLLSPSPNSPDEGFQNLAKCQTTNLEEEHVSEVLNSKRTLGDWDDDNPEIKFRKDATEWEEINSKYCSNSSEGDASRKTGNIVTESTKASGKCKDNHDLQKQNYRVARKILECILQFVQSWSAHAKNCLPPLIRAVQVNDLELINILLASSAPVNATDNDGNTALHWALKQATSFNRCSVNCRVVERLLEAGSSVTSGNNTGATPVHTAAGHGHLDALFLIIMKHEGCINVLTGTKETPLHYAVKNNHLPCAALLLRYGANRDVLSLRSHKPIQLVRSAEMHDLISLNGHLLEEACDQIVASQNCIPAELKYSHFQKTQGTNSLFPDGLSPVKHPDSISQSATSAVSNSYLSVARAMPQNPAEVPEKFQAQPSTQLSAFDSQETDIASNSTSWQTVQKKPRKHTISADAVVNTKEQPPAKTVTLPPFKSVFCRFHGTNKKCEWGFNCHFAHSEEELLKGQQMTLLSQKVEAVHGIQVISSASDSLKNYKIKLCMHYERNGNCPNGLKCKFAHGQKELRPISALPSVLSGARIATRPSTASSFGSFSSEELDDLNSRKVFVGGLPPYVNDKELLEFMDGEFGKVVDSTVICGNDEDGVIRSRGFGFVLFENQKDADEAVRRHYIPFQGKKVELKKAMTRMELASGDELGKQCLSSLGISSAGNTRSPAIASTSSDTIMLDEKLHSGTDAASYNQHLPVPQSSLSMESPQGLIQDDLPCQQSFASDSARFLSENTKIIQKSGQIEKIQNSESVRPVHNNSTVEGSASYEKVYPLHHGVEQLQKLDNTSRHSSFHSYNLCSSQSLNTLPSSPSSLNTMPSSPLPGLSSIYDAPVTNGNINPLNGQPFTYFSSGTSNSYFSTTPGTNHSTQINGRSDEDLSLLLELLQVRPMPESTQAESLCKTQVSNRGVSQSVMPVSFQDSWKSDTLANYQNLDPQSVYSGSWYDSIKNGRDVGCQLSGGMRGYCATGACGNIPLRRFWIQ